MCPRPPPPSIQCFRCFKGNGTTHSQTSFLLGETLGLRFYFCHSIKTEEATHHLTSLHCLSPKPPCHLSRIPRPFLPLQNTIMLQNRASQSGRVILKLQESEERATCNISAWTPYTCSIFSFSKKGRDLIGINQAAWKILLPLRGKSCHWIPEEQVQALHIDKVYHKEKAPENGRNPICSSSWGVSTVV